MSNNNQSADDDLFDEALEGFTKVQTSQPARASAASSSSVPPEQPREAAEAITAKGPKPSPAFDPLKRAQKKKPAPPAIPPDVFGGQGIPPELQSLLAELTAAVPDDVDAEPCTSGRDMDATLDALAKQFAYVVKCTVRSEGTVPRTCNRNLAPPQQAGTHAGLEGLADNPQMQGLVDSIMQQLLSKEVLYQPMKEIGAKYPDWLAANRGSLPAEDLARYEQQYTIIGKICTLYEQPSPDMPALVSLLQEACGQPPPDIVTELAPGLEFDPQGLPVLPGLGGEGDLPPELLKDLEKCCIQ